MGHSSHGTGTGVQDCSGYGQRAADGGSSLVGRFEAGQQVRMLLHYTRPVDLRAGPEKRMGRHLSSSPEAIRSLAQQDQGPG